MFKFYTIPSESILEKLIGTQATIKLSSAYNLNDTFELKFNLEIDPLDEGHKKQYFKDNPGSTNEDFLNWQKLAVENGYNWNAEQQQRAAIGLTISLCSFTKTNKNNLMWSHYTNNHKGICIEYKPKLFDYFSNLKDYLLFEKVNYSDSPPIVKGLDDLNTKIEKIIFNKQSEWKYEKEYRVVFFNDKDTEYLPIDTEFIKAVYIGSRTGSEIEKTILTLCENSNIDVYYGITLGKSYYVNFEKHQKGKGFIRAFWR